MKNLIKTFFVNTFLAYIVSCGEDKAKNRIEDINIDCSTTETPFNIKNLAMYTSWEDVTDNLGLYGITAETGSFGDFNDDGFSDLFIAPSKKYPEIYINTCGTGFIPINLKERTKISENLDYETFKNAATYIADLDNDGFLDVLFGMSGLRHGVRILYGERGLKFTEKVLPMEATSSQIGSVGTIDLDRNEYLDLYIARSPNLQGDIKNENLFFINQGDRNFVDVTSRMPDTLRYAGSFITFTYAFIGWQILNGIPEYKPRLYIGNDFDPDFLFSHKGGFSFDQIESNTIRELTSTMGLDYSYVGDDVVMALTQTFQTAMIRIEPNGVVDISNRLKAPTGHVGWDIRFGNFDNGLDESLIIANAYLVDDSNNPEFGLKDTLFYIQNNHGWFRNKSDTAGSLFDSTDIANRYLLPYGDFNNDGNLDLLVTSYDIQNPEKEISHEPLYDTTTRLLMNKGNSNNWIGFKFKNSKYLGSLLRLRSGDREAIKEIKMFSGLGANNYGFAHLGLGQKSAIDKLELFMRNGKIKDLTRNIEINHYNWLE